MSITLSTSSKQIRGQIHLSSSKSESNRALIINKLAGGQQNIRNLSNARDTRTMQTLLNSNPKIWDVLDAGTTMRFCTAYLALCGDNHVITGTDRMKQRPIGLLAEALQALGADIDYMGKPGYPPLKVSQIRKQKNNLVEIPGNVSSQYISALLMIGPRLPKGLTIRFTSEIFSRPYIEMTLGIMHHFGASYSWVQNEIEVAPGEYRTSDFQVESDWSGASYWYSIAALSKGCDIFLSGLRKQSLQGDFAISEIMSKMGIETIFEKDGVRLRRSGKIEKSIHWDFRECPDLAQTVMAAAAALGTRLNMTGLESLRIKETDRIEAMQNELAKLNANLFEEVKGNWVMIPGEIPETVAPVRTYDDHRMAMAFAPLALLGEMTIEDPDVVAKSYPDFWKDLTSVGFIIQ